jgi:HK97 family phage major capsid protein
MLKALMLRKKLDDVKKQLEAIRAKSEEFATREAELEADIAAASTDEEKAAVEEAIDKFETEKSENEEQAKALEKECEDLERELQETEQKTNTPPPASTDGESRGKEFSGMNLEFTTKRARELFGKMSIEQRTAMFEREDVKSFNEQVRNAIKEKRALSDVGILVPKVYLGLIRENIERYSKLYRHVFVRPLGGEGRLSIMGGIPEAVWTEMCAKLNELDLGFNEVEVDGYKVGGFIPVCNAILEDSEIDLAAEIITVLGQAIGKALDKAILYGKGVKMPLGIVTRLCQTSAPENQSPKARPWVDLSTTNVKELNAALEGITLYRQFMLDASAAKGKYSRGEKVWVMNETTYTQLKATMMNVNAAGAVVSSINGTLPVIGGIVEVLDFIPDNIVIGGYFDLYLLAERAGTRIGQSEHVRFLDDQTVFKGTARYDGLPVIAEGFVVLGLNGTTPTADMLFAPDEANAEVPAPATVTVLQQSDSVYGVAVSDLQSADTMLSGNTFYGTLKYIASGEPATTWGPGYFLAVDFGGADFDKETVRVGVVPTAGSGFATVTTGDTKSIFKVTNKDAQVLKVITTKDGNTVSEIFNLAGLKFESTNA